MASRSYRSRVELFRDFLSAAMRERRKSRILRLANLNHISFSRYASYCVRNGFLVQRNGGYDLTGRAEGALTAVNLVLERASELHSALERFASIVGDGPGEGNRFPVISERRIYAGTRVLGTGLIDRRHLVESPRPLSILSRSESERAMANSMFRHTSSVDRMLVATSSSQNSQSGSEPPSGRRDRFVGLRPGGP
jgi:predicted transcriptional regulator